MVWKIQQIKLNKSKAVDFSSICYTNLTVNTRRKRQIFKMADLSKDIDIETDHAEPVKIRTKCDITSAEISPKAQRGIALKKTPVTNTRAMPEMAVRGSGGSRSVELSNTIQDRKMSSQEDQRNDSGMISMGSSYCSMEPVSRADKTPVQCSDAAKDDEVSRKLGGLSITDDDEGVDTSMSYSSMSFDSETAQTSVPEQEIVATEIEVDLYQRDEDGDTILHVAIVSLFKETALALIELVEEIDCLNIQNNLLQTPLHLAVLTGQVDIVRGLVKKGVDVTLRDQQGNTALHIACRNGDKDAVSRLVQSFGNDQTRRVKYFAMKNCEGLTCMHIAAQKKEFIILGHLFAKGADVNIGDAKSGRTMLHYAVERKDIETVSLLLTHPKIDVDCQTFKGEAPIVMAYWRNYQDIVKKLKAKGAFFSYDLVEDSDDENSS